MSNVKRWAHTVQWEGLQISAAYMAINDGGEYVMHADYAALESVCERLRVKLMVIASAEPARHGIEWAKAIAAECNGEPYAKWRDAIEERDALAAELAAIKGQEVVDCKVVPVELLEQIAVELEHDNDRYFLGRELRAILEAKDE